MKQFFCILLSALFFSSCGSTYFYSKVSSLDDDIFQTDEGDFISERDSFQVSYWFKGYNAPIFINVYNKSDKPLYVDWNKSMLVRDGVPMLYRGTMDVVSGESDHVLEKVKIVNGQEIVTLEDLGRLPRDVSYIAPQSRVTFESNGLVDFKYSESADIHLKRGKTQDKSGQWSDIQTLNFTSENSPLKFQSLLTLYSKTDPEISVLNNFHISSLIKTKDFNPDRLPQSMGDRGDWFYLERKSKNNQFFEVVGGVILVGVVVVAAAFGDYNPDDDYEYDY